MGMNLGRCRDFASFIILRVQIHGINEGAINHDDVEDGITFQNLGILHHRTRHFVFHRRQNHKEKREDRLSGFYSWHPVLCAGHPL